MLSTTPLNDLIEVFKSDEWNLNLGICGTTQAMLRVLENNADVLRLRKLYQEQDIKNELKDVIGTLVSAEFQKGFSFPYDTLLCAVAVALRGERDDFANEYLSDLAAARCAELAQASRVAREIARERGDELLSTARIVPCVQIEVIGPLATKFGLEAIQNEWLAPVGPLGGHPEYGRYLINPDSLEAVKFWLRQNKVKLGE